MWRLAREVLTPIIDNDPELVGLDGVLLSPDERYLYVGSFSVERIARYDLRTGDIVKFPMPGSEPWSLALLPSNRLIFSDGDNVALRTVPLTGGAIETFSDDPDLSDPGRSSLSPSGAAGGSRPLLAPTFLRRSRARVHRRDLDPRWRRQDHGLAGKDIVCGGTGRDRLVGGKGSYRLLGQAGRDRSSVAPPGDVCRGGPGRDLQLGC